MTGPWETEPELRSTKALIESWGLRAQEQADRAESLRQQIEAISVSRWSPGREVLVTLDSTGMLSDVQFAEAARERSAPALSRAVLTALRGAFDDLQARVAEVAERHAEPGHAGPDRAAAWVVASYEQALAAPLSQYRPGDEPGPERRTT